MRPLLASLAGILGVVGLHGRHPTAAATVQVAVDLRCSAPGVHRYTVDPDTAKIAQGDELEWVLADSATTSELTITPKQSAWPFADGLRYHGHHGKPARAKKMKPNQRGKRFGYAVQMICASGSTDTVDIDPQIIIH
ncbi:MAG TPA: hypothetical protein VGQ29_00195 [Gemmatimonadales bacterium]|jgi:hypothetical protein|nr:hypothetical protein [Gemmatimonadales bacterium]